jgi:hypothetical protein
MLTLPLIFALAFGTIMPPPTPQKVVPEWGSVIHFYYRPADCPRSQRKDDGWVGCSRLLVQFGAVRIVPDNGSETPPEASLSSSSSFVPRQHPDGPEVIFTISPRDCKPIPEDLRGLWVCVAPKGKPFSIGWKPQTTETKGIMANDSNAPAKPIK